MSEKKGRSKMQRAVSSAARDTREMLRRVATHDRTPDAGRSEDVYLRMEFELAQGEIRRLTAQNELLRRLVGELVRTHPEARAAGERAAWAMYIERAMRDLATGRGRTWDEAAAAELRARLGLKPRARRARTGS